MWLKETYWREGEMIGLIWDMAPTQANKAIDEFLQSQSDWLITGLIPGGLTSILQVGDLVASSSGGDGAVQQLGATDVVGAVAQRGVCGLGRRVAHAGTRLLEPSWVRGWYQNV